MLNHAACKTLSLCLSCSLQQDIHQQIIIHHQTLDQPPKLIYNERDRDNKSDNGTLTLQINTITVFAIND